MKIERISDKIIRVTISMNDLEERNIDLTSLNYNSPAAQELFWDMMEQAEAELGFSISDSQLIIEPTADSNEGFIITITKVDEDGDFESIQKYIKNRFKRADIRVKKKGRKVLSTVLLYSFNSFEDLCELCTLLKDNYTGDSTLYKYKSTYYLSLIRSGITVNNPKAFESMLGEYGSRVHNTSFFEGFLDEYATVIAENNAIEVLCNYF